MSPMVWLFIEGASCGGQLRCRCGRCTCSGGPPCAEPWHATRNLLGAIWVFDRTRCPVSHVVKLEHRRLRPVQIDLKNKPTTHAITARLALNVRCAFRRAKSSPHGVHEAGSVAQGYRGGQRLRQESSQQPGSAPGSFDQIQPRSVPAEDPTVRSEAFVNLMA